MHDGWGPAPAGSQRRSGAFPGGATLVEVVDAGGPPGPARAWVLSDDADPRALGAALAWSRRQGAAALDLVVDAAGDPSVAGLLAWRAGAFSCPPAVWSLRAGALAPARPVPPGPEPPAPAGARAAAAPFGAFGVEVVVEHGVVRGEVLGLEVARVVPDGAGWRLDVGVGVHDRAARAELRPGEDPLVALARAVAAVREWRRPGVPRHPANTLARDRWLRAVLLAHPELTGASRLAAAAPALPRADLVTPSVAPAVGADAEGRPVVVVASAGIDLDLVPAAADARRRHSPAARLVLAVPEGDDHPVTRDLAAALADPASVAVVRPGWEGLAPAGRGALPR